ncbi:hypothetical protein ACJ72_03854 [Emergomyces africanus]|uniref:Uncharacterized protein n=1 Tax=Emergomyces africanus TaxID=1955775 RepID=A0A1B7NYF3_9EURO|nr:hypothetical protein ACJ72_03854 [Emergomyces africanus]
MTGPAYGPGNVFSVRQRWVGAHVTCGAQRCLREHDSWAQPDAAVRVPDTQMRQFRSEPFSQRITSFLANCLCNPGPAANLSEFQNDEDRAKCNFLLTKGTKATTVMSR